MLVVLFAAAGRKDPDAHTAVLEQEGFDLSAFVSLVETCVCLFVCLFGGRISCSPGWPPTQYASEDTLGIWVPSASSSQVMGL